MNKVLNQSETLYVENAIKAGVPTIEITLVLVLGRIIYDVYNNANHPELTPVPSSIQQKFTEMKIGIQQTFRDLSEIQQKVGDGISKSKSE